MICKNIGEIFTKASNETFLDRNIKTIGKIIDQNGGLATNVKTPDASIT